MIERVHHTSISVSNLDKSLRFYRDVLGLKLVYTAEAEGEETSKGVGIKGAQLKIAVFTAGNDTVELINYVNPKGKPYDRIPCDIGNMHLAFRVTDVNEMYRELTKKGVKFNAPPSEIKTGPMKGWIWTYFNDPDGSQLELVEQK